MTLPVPDPPEIEIVRGTPYVPPVGLIVIADWLARLKVKVAEELVAET